MTHFLDEEKPPRWFVFFMAVAITVAIMMALSSCSSSQIANRKLRRADKLIKQAEALGAKVDADTVFVEKIVPGPSTSVEIPVERLVHLRHDTTIYQDRIRLHYVTYRDTLKMTVECDPDTIRVPVTVRQSILCPPIDHTWRTVAAVLACLLLVFVLIKR
jgi:hypothetical protein